MNFKGLLLFVLMLLLHPANSWAACSGDYEDAIIRAGDELECVLQKCDGVKEMLLALASSDEPRVEKRVKKVVIMSDKPRLGLLLKREYDQDTESVGAEVQGVTPHGPADEAGIKAGDIITKVNGESLAVRPADADEDESGPASKLVAFAGKLKEGDKVTLEYRRGRETNTATLTARKIDGISSKNMAGPGAKKKVIVKQGSDDEELFDLSDIEDMPDVFSFCWKGGGWLDMEMVAMNPGLGEYFGTSEGILVVKAPADSPLQLKSGDVILKIGDRSPKTPAQAIRIIRSYEAGEEISLQVMRKHQRQVLKAKAPDHEKDFDFDYFDSDDMPVPPPPPSPPPAPARGASVKKT